MQLAPVKKFGFVHHPDQPAPTKNYKFSLSNLFAKAAKQLPFIRKPTSSPVTGEVNFYEYSQVLTNNRRGRFIKNCLIAYAGLTCAEAVNVSAGAYDRAAVQAEAYTAVEQQRDYMRHSPLGLNFLPFNKTYLLTVTPKAFCDAIDAQPVDANNFEPIPVQLGSRDNILTSLFWNLNETITAVGSCTGASGSADHQAEPLSPPRLNPGLAPLPAPLAPNVPIVPQYRTAAPSPRSV